MKRALLYLRQSDSEGAGERSLSLESQAAVLREDAARQGWLVVGEIRDADMKGYDERRPGLLELYTRCRAGAADVVAFWKLDRLARSLRLQENCLHELAQLGVDVWSNQDPHLGTPFFRQIFGAFNEEQTRIISAHVRRAVHQLHRDGRHHGRAPFGYQRTERGTLAPGPEADVVRAVYALRAEGRSLAEIRDWLIRHGVRTPTGNVRWHRSMLNNLLTNPAYIGAVQMNGARVEGAHEPIVDADLWQRVQAIALSHRERAPRHKQDTSWLEGLVLHACGAAMYLDGGRPHKQRPHFTCGATSWQPDITCAHRPRGIERERAETLTWRAVCEDFARLRPGDAVYREIVAAYQAEAPLAERARRETGARQERIMERRQRTEDLYLSGVRDRAWFDAEDARLAAEEREIAAQLATLPAPPDEAAVLAVWRSLSDMQRMLTQIEPADRGGWLRALGLAVVSPAGVPDIAIGSRPGPKPDAGRVTIRYRPEIAPFLANSRG